MKRVIGVLAGLWCWSLASGAADDALPAIMQRLAAVKTLEARFEERKTLAMLQRPLLSSGELYYRAPAYLRKRTLQPQPEDYTVDGDWLTVETVDSGRRDFALSGYPQLLPFVEALRATQAGDRATLERYYQVECSGTAESWQLHLTPRDPAAAEYLSAIVIHGRQGWIDRIETQEADGDRSLMTVTPR